MKNALTIDVEEYFQVAALAEAVPRARWDAMPSRLHQGLWALLKLFDARGVKATFFTLGWVAQRHPGLVRDIVAGGHELASHGFDHRNVFAMRREDFFDDLVRARGVLEEIGCVEVRGYRAPNFSIDSRTPWAHEMMAKAGLRYSSSIYPARAKLGAAFSSVAQTPWGVTEIPVSSPRIFGRAWPAGGGGYFRLLPYRVSARLVAHVNEVERQPAVFYLHPWELDAHQPRLAGLGPLSRFRHYINLDRTHARLDRLLQDFSWGRMDEVFL